MLTDLEKELLEALKDMFANGLPEQTKSCGHEYLCVCPERKALAVIKKAEEFS